MHFLRLTPAEEAAHAPRPLLAVLVLNAGAAGAQQSWRSPTTRRAGEFVCKPKGSSLFLRSRWPRLHFFCYRWRLSQAKREPARNNPAPALSAIQRQCRNRQQGWRTLSKPRSRATFSSSIDSLLRRTANTPTASSEKGTKASTPSLMERPPSPCPSAGRSVQASLSVRPTSLKKMVSYTRAE